MLALLWAVWATHKIMVLGQRRTVAVRLQSLVGDFVNAEARSGDSPDQIRARTTAYMSTLDALLKKRAATGETILVGEAVVGESATDITPEIAGQLARLVTLPRPVAIPPAAAPAPATGVAMPGQPLPAQPQPQALALPQPDQAGQGGATGFEAPAQPANPFAGAAPTGGN